MLLLVGHFCLNGYHIMFYYYDSKIFIHVSSHFGYHYATIAFL